MTAWLVDNTPELIDQFDAVATEAGSDPEDEVHVVGLLRAVKRSLDSAINAREARLCELIGDDTLTVDGVARVNRVPKFKNVTYGTRLALAVAAQVADTPADEDGVALPPGVLCARTAEAVVDAFGLDTPSTNFRSTSVKSMGLKPGAFRESERVGWRLQWDEV